MKDNGGYPTWDFWLFYILGAVITTIVIEVLKAKGIL